jgi:hypothetical protein
MFGAIAGDVIGSAYEWHRTKREDFILFTSESAFKIKRGVFCD